MDAIYRGFNPLYLYRVRSTQDEYFAGLMRMYVDLIDPRLRCSTNEIAYWVDHYPRRYPNDQFYLLGLCDGPALYGFCQCVVIQKDGQGYIFIDYLAIDKKRLGRKSKEYLDLYIQLLKSFFQRQYPNFPIVIEAMDLSGEAFRRLLRRYGFAGTGYPYHQYVMREGQEQQRGELFLFPPQPNMPLKDYLPLLRTLRDDHYLRWQQIAEPA